MQIHGGEALLLWNPTSSSSRVLGALPSGPLPVMLFGVS